MSIVVPSIGLQRISPSTVCQFPQFLVVTICDLPDIINCLFHVFSTFGSRAFSVAGPTVRNSLPDDLCDPTVNSVQFRRDLKTYQLFA